MMKGMKVMKRTTPFFIPFVVGILFSVSFFVSAAHADDVPTSCDDLSGDEKKQCEDYNDKIKSYQKIIDLKKVQGATLADQIESLTAQTAKLSLQIQTTERDISAVSTALDDTRARIAEKERIIAREKQVLSEMIRAYQSGADDGSGILIAVSGDDLGGLFSKNDDWMLETNGRIVGILKDMAAVKRSLEGERGTLAEKKEKVEALKLELGKKNDELATARRGKASLLVKTMSEQEKYEDLLEKVKQQKEELLNFSGSANLTEVFASLSSYAKPDSKYHASTSWYYSQRDPRWADEEIGKTKSEMADWGCAVTSVAMTFTGLGSRVSPGTLANKNSLFDRDLIIWPNSWSGGVALSSSTFHGNVNWKTIDERLKEGKPVIVYIKRSRGGGHYVVIHTKDNKGRYVVHDPYFGPNIFLDTSRSLVGKLGTTSSTSIDQMIIYSD